MADEPVVFGPTFASELEAAGLAGLPFSWNINSGEFFGREDLTDEQNATLDGVIAAHDPTKQLPPTPEPWQVAVVALTKALQDAIARIETLEAK